MKWVVKTDIGVVREENQDRAAVFAKGNIILSILCDGMGGHTGGSYASRLTIEALEKEFVKNTPSNPDKLFEWFKSALKKAKSLMEKSSKGKPELLDMGTTVTIAFIFKSTSDIYVFNIGDSRTYIYNGLLHQITVDHNLRNYYIHEEGISEEKASGILGGSALTSALGPKKTTKVDAFQLGSESGAQYVILTSDGIHDYISKPLFEQIVGSNKDMDSMTDQLIKQAIKGKSTDNCTVVVVEVMN